MRNKKKDLRSSAGLRSMILMAAICIVLRLWIVWDPAAIVPKPDVSFWTTVSAVAVLSGQLMKPQYIQACGTTADILWAAAAFTVFPWCAGLLSLTWVSALKLAVISGATYAVTAVILNSMRERITLTGSGALSHTGHLSLAVNGFLLILAVQAFDRIVW